MGYPVHQTANSFPSSVLEQRTTHVYMPAACLCLLYVVHAKVECVFKNYYFMHVVQFPYYQSWSCTLKICMLVSEEVTDLWYRLFIEYNYNGTFCIAPIRAVMFHVQYYFSGAQKQTFSS